MFRKFKLKRLLEAEYWLYLVDVVLRRPNVENGLIDYTPYGKDEIHFKGKDEVLGNTKQVLLEDGDWMKYRPLGELQKRNNSETMACVSYSATNAIEIIINRFQSLAEKGEANEEQEEIVKIFKHFGLLKQVDPAVGVFHANVSDRAIAKLSNTSYRGNTQARVADAIRNYGLVPEEAHPWVDDWDKYYSPVPADVIEQGKKILEYIEINYEWANPSIARDSLKYAPLQTSGFGWNGTENGAYYRTTTQKNHAFIKDKIDNLAYIFDSYDPFHKKTTLDFLFGWDMIFTLHLKKKLTPYNQTEIDKLRNERGWEYIVLVKDFSPQYTQGVYKLTTDGLVKLKSSDTVDEWVMVKKKNGDLEGVSPDFFARLVN